jgi:hypothetical protein
MHSVGSTGAIHPLITFVVVALGVVFSVMTSDQICKLQERIDTLEARPPVEVEVVIFDGKYVPKGERNVR